VTVRRTHAWLASPGPSLANPAAQRVHPGISAAADLDELGQNGRRCAGRLSFEEFGTCTYGISQCLAVLSRIGHVVPSPPALGRSPVEVVEIDIIHTYRWWTTSLRPSGQTPPQTGRAC
jgi:hypothetical protein